MKEDVLLQRGKTIISHVGSQVRKTAEEVPQKTADHHNQCLFPVTANTRVYTMMTRRIKMKHLSL